MPLARSIVIHGHFYQPPREDPWLDEVEAEPSAAPFHDWNERIEQECYRAVAAARLPGAGGRIGRIVNAYSWLSFNFGPTLLEWLEGAAPSTYAALLEGDRASAARLGHGNALAMPYHHSILPLSSYREKVTEVRWGIADFRRRFGRDPEGMWLPETAMDEETLDVLAQAGIRFTVLAPSQVEAPPPLGLPGLVHTASGRSIAVFIYDGAISHDVAFGPLVRDAGAWVARLLAVSAHAPEPALVAVATDGETYGHHHDFAEMALVNAFERLRHTANVTVENFASFLARHPATHPVKLVTPSAWSCAHGVGRWKEDCGCRMAPEKPTNQRWRAPLREAIAWLTSECHALYQREAPALLRDPEEALAGYGGVMGAGPGAVRAYADAAARVGLAEDRRVRAAELLEMERGALRTLTSCAWFFDDIAGIETVQVLRYAAWVIELAGAEAARLEEGFVSRLARAESNYPTIGSGRQIYLQRARPHRPPPLRIAAGLTAARMLAPAAATSAAWELTGPTDAAQLVNRRTGRTYPMAVEVAEHGLELTVTVGSPPQQAPVALELRELPERQRTALEAALRGRVLARLLPSEDRSALERGDPLEPILRRALARQVRRLAQDRSEASLGEVVDLLRLLEEQRRAVPFEVQTLFWNVWQGDARNEPGMLELARRMGFDPTATAEPG